MTPSNQPRRVFSIVVPGVKPAGGCAGVGNATRRFPSLGGCDGFDRCRTFCRLELWSSGCFEGDVERVGDRLRRGFRQGDLRPGVILLPTQFTAPAQQPDEHDRVRGHGAEFNRAYFHRIFKQVTGEGPARFRRKHRWKTVAMPGVSPRSTPSQRSGPSWT